MVEILLVAVLASVIVMAPAPARAATNPIVAKTVIQNASTSASAETIESAPPFTSSPKALSAGITGGSLRLPLDAHRGVTATVAGTSVALDLPSQGPASRVGQTVVYRGSTVSNSITVQPISDGFRALIALRSPAAPKEYRFPFSGDVARVEMLAGGGLALYAADGSEIGTVDRPWATDKHGDPVPTHFTVSGSVVTQVVDVDHATAFPVIADPAVHVHWTTVTLEFYPSDQRAIIAGVRQGGLALVAGIVCTLFGPEAGFLCGAVAQAAAGVIASEISDHYHPHCHLNLSIYKWGTFDRIWMSRCTR